MWKHLAVLVQRVLSFRYSYSNDFHLIRIAKKFPPHFVNDEMRERKKFKNTRQRGRFFLIQFCRRCERRGKATWLVLQWYAKDLASFFSLVPATRVISHLLKPLRVHPTRLIYLCLFWIQSMTPLSIQSDSHAINYSRPHHYSRQFLDSTDIPLLRRNIFH